MSNGMKAWAVLWRNTNRRRHLYICLAVIALVATLQPMLVQQVYSQTEIRELLNSLRDSSLYFGSATATASATILALMLTLLSMASQIDKEFDRSVYQEIQLIGLISTVTFILSLILLLCLSLPVGEFDQIPLAWFKALYYVISVLNGVLSGLMIVGVLTLFDTIKLLIRKVAPNKQ